MDNAFAMTPDVRAAHMNAQQGSLALLKALLRYGLKRGGLPGMTTEQFQERCREYSIG